MRVEQRNPSCRHPEVHPETSEAQHAALWGASSDWVHLGLDQNAPVWTWFSNYSEAGPSQLEDQDLSAEPAPQTIPEVCLQALVRARVSLSGLVPGSTMRT